MADEHNKDAICFEYIQTTEQLKALTSRLESAQEVALDIEADSFHHYKPKVCLIQLCFEEQIFLVDPLADIDLKPFLKELSHKNLILHDAGYDFRMLNMDFGFKPKQPVYDTMLAASLAGLENVGLSGLLKSVLSIDVAKHNQKADWSRRPLPEHLLSYAAEDTIYLARIKQHLQQELERLGRTDWHTECCQWAVQAAYTLKDQTDPDNDWRIKGTGKLPAKEKAFLQQIWFWRNGIAKRTNIAPFMIMHNHAAIKLAVWAARRRKPIDDQTPLPVRTKKNKDSLLEALQKAQQMPPEQWPEPRKSDPSKRLPDSTRKIVNDLKDACEAIANEINLPLQIIASRAALTQIVLNKADTLKKIQDKKILMNWQANLLLPAIQTVLKNKEDLNK